MAKDQRAKKDSEPIRWWHLGQRDPITVFSGWLAIWTLVLSIMTGISAVVLAITDSTLKHTLIDSNRAWLAPTHFEFLKSLEEIDGPSFIGHYQNVGRFPALDVKTGMGWIALPLTKKLVDPRGWPESPMWASIDQIARSGCLSNKPIEGSASVFPSTTIENNMVAGPSTSPGDKSEINVGTQIILVTGCLTYKTFDETHHTGFCRYITKARTGQWEFLSCQAGNFAD
jgi:hypothetical protein